MLVIQIFYVLMSVADFSCNLNRFRVSSRQWGEGKTYTASWEIVQGAQILGNGEAGEERGGNSEGLHLDPVVLVVDGET